MSSEFNAIVRDAQRADAAVEKLEEDLRLARIAKQKALARLEAGPAGATSPLSSDERTLIQRHGVLPGDRDVPWQCGRCGLRLIHGECECSPAGEEPLEVEGATETPPIRSMAADVAEMVAVDGPVMRVGGLAVQVKP